MSYRVVLLVRRKNSLTPEEFKWHYENKHIPLVRNIAGEMFPLSHNRRYVRRTKTESGDIAFVEDNVKPNADYPATVMTGTQEGVSFDCITEMVFANQGEFYKFSAVLAAGDAAKQIQNDCEQFMDVVNTDMFELETCVETTATSKSQGTSIMDTFDGQGYEEAEKKLAGGLAVITGAGSGIGAGIARRAADLGMTVVLADINLPWAEEVARQIEAAHGAERAMAIRVDVSRAEELDRLADEVYTRFPAGPRLLVNNAGIETLGFAWEVPVRRWDATMNINVLGVVHGVRAFMPRMLAAGAECWVANVTSVGAFGMMPTQTAYMMSKHAVESFSEGLFLEMQLKGADHVHVCSVMPGMVRTGIFDANTAKDEGVGGDKYRKTMHDLMCHYGMDLDEGCRRIMAQVAAGKFWVVTQPAMIEDAINGRVTFFKERTNPTLAEQARHLVM